MLNLALHGIISLTDKRVQVSPEPVIDHQTERVTDEFVESDNVEENNTKE